MSDDVSSWNQAGDGGSETTGSRSPGASERELAALRAEVGALRDAARVSPQRTRELEARLAHVQTSLSTLSTQNERLVRTLKEAREQIVTLKSEVDRLAQPPAAYGIVMESYDDATVDILTGGRKMHVAVSPAVDPAELSAGREVRLNEAMNVVATCGFERTGEVVMIKELLGDDRVLVVAHADEERVCRIADSLEGEPIRVGDALMLEPRTGFVYERIPKAEVAELVLEEVPDIDYEDIGGLAGLIVRPSLKNRGTPQVRAPLIRAKSHNEPPLEDFSDCPGWDRRTAHSGRVTRCVRPGT